MGRFDYMNLAFDLVCKICHGEIDVNHQICEECVDRIIRARSQYPKGNWILRTCTACHVTKYGNKDYYLEHPKLTIKCPYCKHGDQSSIKFFSYNNLKEEGIIK